MKFTYNRIFYVENINKIIICIISILTILVINIFYFNQILMIILDPLIKTNFDNFNQIKNNQFSIFKNLHLIYDNDLCSNINLKKIYIEKNNIKYLINNSFEYMPCFEINLNINNTSNTYLLILCFSTIYYSLPYIFYQIFLNNNKITIKKIINFIIFFIVSQLITIKLIIPIIYKITIHNYQEYIYFEFDVGFDFFQFIITYYKILYIITLNIFIYLIIKQVNIKFYNNILILLILYSFKNDLMILTIIIFFNIILFLSIKIHILFKYYIFLKKNNIKI